MKTRHLFIGILIGIAIGLVLTSTYLETPKTTSIESGPVRAIATNMAVADDTVLLPDERNTIEVFQQVAPSVVFITSKALRRDFFSLDVFEIPAGSGSGFIWDEQGHVVTNNHVIENADALTVTLSNHSSYEAEVVGTEPSKDIAVLRIKAASSSLKPVQVGSSTNLQVGQKVLAIGNPFGLDQTLTTGVVSAVGREIKTSGGRTIQDVIQTDAAINPGNSGGPLLNSRGQLIGINTAIISPSGSSAGIGFAVPVNTVMRVVPQLIKYGKVIRPGLGVSVINDAYARRLGIEGVIIGEVQRGGPADKAGLQGLQRNWRGELILGDVIVGIDDAKIRSFDELSNVLERYKVGDEVNVKFLRNDKERSVRVRLQRVN
ncbi:MAG: trypsin-like peptidase domain-containing protein [candidate division KSB1 bacterium]|nr:trypsin-like peptidase domain-containing protein [candidate division KSB1 bacterium]MDZ7301072.1 trypsin-like peptidase domain-containing protein [candidate division KSB1 bacterium]MDZ7312104.1 trypsin-like peptidase domain-containing protein [candidate division KSB1 bacterium]